MTPEQKTELLDALDAAIEASIVETVDLYELRDTIRVGLDFDETGTDVDRIADEFRSAADACRHVLDVLDAIADGDDDDA